MKKSSYVRDAFILCLITIVAGLSLGFIYTLTKEPIEKAKLAAKASAYQQVFSEAKEFKSADDLIDLATFNEELAKESFGNVKVDTFVLALDEEKNELGYVIEASSNDAYGGRLALSVGISKDKLIKGIAYLELNETPGLGMKANEESFYKQFENKNTYLKVVKDEAKEVEDISAISGATITTSAVTSAVNAAFYLVDTKLLK